MRLNPFCLLFVLFLNVAVFAITPMQPIVSPHIIRGFSTTLLTGYTPFIQQLGFQHSYHERDRSNNIVTDIRSISLAQFRVDGHLNFGYEIFEISMFSWLPITLPVGIFLPSNRIRLNISVLQTGENNKLFRNSTASVFAGVVNLALIDFMGVETRQGYLGISLGTIAETKSNNTIELFTSPSVNFIRYRYNNVNFWYHGYSATPTIHRREIARSTEINIPFAKRLIIPQTRRRISFTYGFSLNFLLNQDVPNRSDLQKNNSINFSNVPDSITRWRDPVFRQSISNEWLDTPRVRVSLFAGTGFHLGNRTIGDRIRERGEKRATPQEQERLAEIEKMREQRQEQRRIERQEWRQNLGQGDWL